MTSKRRQVGRGFWRSWVSLILVGVAIQFVLPGRWFEQSGFFGGAAVVGAIQWRAMRGQASQSRWRVLAIMGGYAVGFATAHALRHAITGPVRFAVFWAELATVSAIITGIALLLLLRQRVPESPEQ